MTSGFQLTGGDIQILKLLFEYRILRIDHLIALTERHHKAIHRRLFKLIEQRYVSRIKLPGQKHLYTIGKEAVPVLVQHGIDARPYSHELKELFLKHFLMIVDIHTALALATRGSPIKLAAWKQGDELHDSVTIRSHGEEQRIPVWPDAFFTLEDTRRPPGKNRVHFFLEADRSTTAHERFQKKLTGYLHYHDQKLHTKKYGINTFRVVTLTLTKERASNLCQLAETVIPAPARKYYLFTSLTNFSLTTPSAILERIFISPRDTHFHALLPALGLAPVAA